MTDREAMQMSLGALITAKETTEYQRLYEYFSECVEQLRQALAQPEPKPTLFFGRAVYFADPKTGEKIAQPEQEPVAYADQLDLVKDGDWDMFICKHASKNHEGSRFKIPLFTAPPSKQEPAEYDAPALYKAKAEREQEPVALESIEQYRMQMAAISTAAIGYWKEGDNIHPDYNTPALRDVANLYAKYSELYAAPSSKPDDLLRQSEQEGWRWAKECEAEVKRLRTLLAEGGQGCAECGVKASDGYALYCVKCVEPMFKKEWVSLTDEEIDEAIESCKTTDTYKYFRSIEAKLKEKNNG